MKDTSHRRIETATHIAAVIGCVTGVLSFSWAILDHYGFTMERAMATYALDLVPTEKSSPQPKRAVQLIVTNLGSRNLYIQEVYSYPKGELLYVPDEEIAIAPGSYQMFTFEISEQIAAKIVCLQNIDAILSGDAKSRVCLVTSRRNRFLASPEPFDRQLMRWSQEVDKVSQKWREEFSELQRSIEAAREAQKAPSRDQASSSASTNIRAKK